MPKRDEHQTIITLWHALQRPIFLRSDASIPEQDCDKLYGYPLATVFMFTSIFTIGGLILYNYTDCGLCHATRLRTRQRHFGRLLQTLSFVYMIFSLCHCIFIACNHQWRRCNPWICVGYIHDVVAQIQNAMEFPLLIRQKINTNKKDQWSAHFP